MPDKEINPQPNGKLTLRTTALPKDTNGYGHVYAGWMVSQMDLAAAAAAEQIAKCRVVTVAIEQMDFVSPVKVGSVLCFYSSILEVGRTSIRLNIEVWAHRYNESERHKVTDAEFVVVAVDDKGLSKTIKQA